jgi:ABC-2 type transport system permease protein
VARLSPFGWVPGLPAEDLDVVPLIGLAVGAGALAAVALTAFRRRDLTA